MTAPTPPPYQPQPEPPKKSRKKLWWIIGGIVAVIVIIAAVSGGGDKKDDDKTEAASNSTSQPAQQPGINNPPSTQATQGGVTPDEDGTVVYEVTGDSGSAGTITYFTEGGNQSQANGESLPWKSKALDKDKTTIKGVTAQNAGSGDISCKIIVDGKVEVENTSSGSYAVVSCNGKLF
ncbi:hypothetical protein JVX90_00015 [Gordonia sp. PDNC005]|uniref:MmpS family transport accessory protein n=1 Tax=Gordonia sp. PDNC005 TaxID=2811424 RepID=UPI001962C95E|nr:MmpS family transport accessory protein [Gordonia sp. PDNC005]QRY62697.1 hypothetical protein JVX90_00015 [Gordonia sp. PDNC005]